jgi:hypothetical protein
VPDLWHVLCGHKLYKVRVTLHWVESPNWCTITVCLYARDRAHAAARAVIEAQRSVDATWNSASVDHCYLKGADAIAT